MRLRSAEAEGGGPDEAVEVNDLVPRTQREALQSRDYSIHPVASAFASSG